MLTLIEQNLFAQSKSDSKTLVACDPAGHELDHGDVEEGLRGFGEALEVSGEAAIDADPGEGALDAPSLWLHDEACVGSPDDLARSRSGGRAPVYPWSTQAISTLSPVTIWIALASLPASPRPSALAGVAWRARGWPSVSTVTWTFDPFLRLAPS